MRPQKPKKDKRHKTQNRWEGYYLSDIECKTCTNFRGKKRGCILSECEFEEEKLGAVKNGRIKRKRGASSCND